MIHLTHEWQHTPDEGDPIECRTWARLAWRAGAATLTRAYDRRTRAERDSIFVPLYPLARWALNHWWSLLYETWPGEELPDLQGPLTADAAHWLRAHCARAGLPGYAFPFTCIFSRGRDLAIINRADPHDHHTHTSVEFTESLEIPCERDELTQALGGLVTSVLNRLDQLGYTDERVEALRADWTALLDAPVSEREFCRAAGRLGLDPYDTSSWPPQILEWFERAQPGDLDRSFAVDLLDSPDHPSTKPRRFTAIRTILEQHHLLGAPQAYGAGATTTIHAHEEGYELARWIRRALDLAPDAPLLEVPAASEALTSRPLRFVHDPTFPHGRVLAAVGWTDAPLLIARPTVRDDKLRFLGGRALYLALRGASEGPRLVTDARTTEQRTSRAFSAELLAPQDGVARMYDAELAESGRDDALTKLADHYRVSPMVIEHQLANFRQR